MNVKSYYYLKDHIGNIRVTIDQDAVVVTKDDFYPFGLQMGGLSYNNGNPNDRYKFKGKAYDQDCTSLNRYHFGWRDYRSPDLSGRRPAC